MRKLLLAAGACLLVGLGAGQAQAGIYTDDLSRCIVKSSSPKDRQDFVVFIYAAMSAHPDVRQYSRISEADRSGFAKRAAQLMERLLLVDCRKEAVAALKYEREQSVSAAFGTLGETAMVDLMGNPDVDKYMNLLAEGLDESKWEALAAEAK